MDRDGLVLADQASLSDAQRRFARTPAEIAGWSLAVPGRATLGEVVAHARPTVLIGTSGQPGAFDEATIRRMAADTPRPIIFPLSNPATHCEAHPADLIAWTEGRAIVGTGSPFGVGGVAQVNNVYIFPGVGLGVLAAGARRVSDGMFLAAARMLASEARGRPGLLPDIRDLRRTALAVARAVAERAVAEGLATRNLPALDSEVWEPTYAA